MQPTLTETARLKKALRAEMKLKSASLTTKYRSAADRAMLEHLLKMPEFVNSNVLFCYVSISGEPDTRTLLEYAFSQGKRVAVPLCDSRTHTMNFRFIESIQELIPGCYDILEPPASAKRAEPVTGLAIIPALCYDRLCGRLGRGGGYYDRFLADFKGVSVGLCYAELLSKKPIPRESFDLSVNAVVTEKEILYNNMETGR